MGFPLPTLFAFGAGASEFLGGLALAAGLAARPAGLFLLATMLVAAYVANAGEPLAENMPAHLYGLFFLVFLLRGAGVASLDGLARRWVERNGGGGAAGRRDVPLGRSGGRTRVRRLPLTAGCTVHRVGPEPRPATAPGRMPRGGGSMTTSSSTRRSTGRWRSPETAFKMRLPTTMTPRSMRTVPICISSCACDGKPLLKPSPRLIPVPGRPSRPVHQHQPFTR